MSDVQYNLDMAAAHAKLDAPVPPAARLRFAKQVVQRAARLFTSEQTIFNQSVLAILQAELDDRRPGTAAALATIETMVAGTNDRLARVEQAVDQALLAVQDAAKQRAADMTEMAILRGQVELLLTEARRRLPEPFDNEQLQTFASVMEMRSDQLYSDFEATFRGSRETVMERQEVYLGDVLPFKDHPQPLVDLGSGRAEWLELLRDNDIPAYGVDVNDDFIAQAKSRGLDLRAGDAVQHLHELPEGSVAGVTAFHLVEHLPLAVLIELVTASLRAIKPGGIVIFESPNPTNLRVGAADFYVDPTHQRPLHPQFLSWLLMTKGFVDVQLRFLNPSDESFPTTLADGEDADLLNQLSGRLNELLYGSRDFAVVARKAPSA